MSKLAQAGESKTTSPGCASRAASSTASRRVAAGRHRSKSPSHPGYGRLPLRSESALSPVPVSRLRGGKSRRPCLGRRRLTKSAGLFLQAPSTPHRHWCPWSRSRSEPRDAHAPPPRHVPARGRIATRREWPRLNNHRAAHTSPPPSHFRRYGGRSAAYRSGGRFPPAVRELSSRSGRRQAPSPPPHPTPWRRHG
jgi:hypothetical protein